MNRGRRRNNYHMSVLLTFKNYRKVTYHKKGDN